MSALILLKYWKHIAIVLVVISLVVGFFAYKKSIYNDGFLQGKTICNEMWTKRENERIALVNSKIKEIEEESVKIVQDQQKFLGDISTKLGNTAEKLKRASAGIKIKELTTVPDCKPSNEFIDISNETAKTVNH